MKEIGFDLNPIGKRSRTRGSHRPQKLSAKYYGPYQIRERIGEVAYRLELPEGAQIHPAFNDNFSFFTSLAQVRNVEYR